MSEAHWSRTFQSVRTGSISFETPGQMQWRVDLTKVMAYGFLGRILAGVLIGLLFVADSIGAGLLVACFFAVFAVIAYGLAAIPIIMFFRGLARQKAPAYGTPAQLAPLSDSKT